jgi:hypothetical protein
MRTLFDFLRRLVEAKDREVAALEKIGRATWRLEQQTTLATARLEEIAAALEGIRESLLDRPDAEDYSVAWRVGVPKPEGE